MFLTIAIFVTSLILVGYVAVAYFMVQGATNAERKAQEVSPADFGQRYEDIEFPSRRGDVTLKGWFLPATASGPFATVIFVHGLDSIRSSDDAVEIAVRLNEHGFAALLFDLRAHGESSGDRVSAGYFERSDVLGAYDYAVARGSYSVGLIGFSMGAGTAVLAAAEEPAISALVADSSFADASDLIVQETARRTPIPEYLVPVFLPAAHFLADRLYGIRIDAVQPEKAAAKLTYPILVIHGDADDRIPLSHGRRVFDAAPAGSDFWIVKGAGHVDAFEIEPEAYLVRIENYLRQRLFLE